MFIGGLLATFEVLLCERWCLCAFCGVRGRIQMIEVLKTVRRLWRGLSLYFLTHCIFRQLLLFRFW
jgi:hypothetical protein